MVLLGICSDANSSFLKGAAEAPPRIREALHCGSSNLTSETGFDLGDPALFADAGDRPVGGGPAEYLGIERHVAECAVCRRRPEVYRTVPT